MTEPAKKLAVYEDLFRIPENMTGEIINGELHATRDHPGNMCMQDPYWEMRSALHIVPAVEVRADGSFSLSPR